jgi:hypothetical protein
LEAEVIFVRFFLIAILNSPCYETPKNAMEKKSNKTTEERGKNRGKKGRAIKKKTEEKIVVFRFFELIKNSHKKK